MQNLHIWYAWVFTGVDPEVNPCELVSLLNQLIEED